MIHQGHHRPPRLNDKLRRFGCGPLLALLNVRGLTLKVEWARSGHGDR
jgi:hypothetical protein